MSDAPLFCHRCGAELTPGRGNFYAVRIEAVADPFPPVIDGEDVAGDIAGRISGLIEQMRGLSDQELMDQVYRRLIVYLCRPCYETWIENPTG